jgi:hypothetical protein
MQQLKEQDVRNWRYSPSRARCSAARNDVGKQRSKLSGLMRALGRVAARQSSAQRFIRRSSRRDVAPEDEPWRGMRRGSG